MWEAATVRCFACHICFMKRNCCTTYVVRLETDIIVSSTSGRRGSCLATFSYDGPISTAHACTGSNERKSLLIVYKQCHLVFSSLVMRDHERVSFISHFGHKCEKGQTSSTVGIIGGSYPLDYKGDLRKNLKSNAYLCTVSPYSMTVQRSLV